MRRLAFFLAAVLAVGQARASTLANWAVIIAAGDDQAAHENRHTDAFDNARRDVADLLVKRGVSRSKLAEFSIQPTRDRAETPVPGDPARMFDVLGRLARSAPGGCLIYLTSHGSPDGVVIGPSILPPRQMAAHVAEACGARPTVIIISACFSGVFVPALQSPNRFILTAARRDRSSFGCGESDKYPYFDACLIQALPTAPDFFALARRATACVARREDEEGLRPRSHPQLWVGTTFRRDAPTFNP